MRVCGEDDRRVYTRIGIFCGREGEDRTGALLAERETLMHSMAEKESQLVKAEAALQEAAKIAHVEAQKQVCLVASNEC